MIPRNRGVSHKVRVAPDRECRSWNAVLALVRKPALGPGRHVHPGDLPARAAAARGESVYLGGAASRFFEKAFLVESDVSEATFLAALETSLATFLLPDAISVAACFAVFLVAAAALSICSPAFFIVSSAKTPVPVSNTTAQRSRFMNVLGGALVSIGSQDLLRLEEDHMTPETFLLWVVV